MIHGDNRYNGVNVHPIGINHIIFLLRLPWNLLNQFNNTIIIRPPVMFLTIALNLLIMSMDYFESPHPSPTLLLILYTFPNHHACSTTCAITNINGFSYLGIFTNSSF
jgi:hypothetical protein